MNKLKCIFISVAVMTWVQVILVFLVDCTVFYYLNNSHILRYKNGPLVDAVTFFSTRGAEPLLLGWTIPHFIFHTAWFASSCILFINALKPIQSVTFSAKSMKQYAIVTILVCLCDIGACIHTSVFARQYYYYYSYDKSKIFFPLFYSKIGAFWIYNVTVAVLMLDVLMKANMKRKRDSIKEDIAHHHSIETPVIAHQHQQQGNDLVDNFYTHQSMPATHQPTSAILPPLSQIQPKSYQSELNRPPYYAEYMQRQSAQIHHAPVHIDVPIPDY